MTPQEHKAFETCIKEIKHTAIINQLYEFAANTRDLEKDLTMPVNSSDQTLPDWHRVASLDTFQYYDRVERLINQYSTPKIDESLRKSFKDLYCVVMRPVIRQEMISKILGDEN